MLTREQTAEMLSLQAQLSYSVARSDVECYCTPVDEWRERWHDTRNVLDDDHETVDRAIRYLDLRGLLERHENGVRLRVLCERYLLELRRG